MLVCASCSHDTPPPNADAGIAVTRAAAPNSRVRRRRGRRGGAHNAVASTGNGNAGSGNAGISQSGNAQSNSHGPLINDPGLASADDMAMGDEPEESAPRERPRMTEAGPMLPEDVGRAGNIAYDMTTAGAPSGPMGLEPSQISRGLDPLLGRMSNCAAATADSAGHRAHGRVTVRLRIHPSGAPAAARVSGGGGSAEFVTCVRRVVASARFASFGGPDSFATWGFDVD